MADLLAEKSNQATLAELDLIHLNKTAALLECALVMGGHIGGASSEELALLRRAGRHLGLTFQIVDDILDATAGTATLGKTAGKDAKVNKTTYLKLHGMEEAKHIAQKHTQQAVTAIASLPGQAREVSRRLRSQFYLLLRLGSGLDQLHKATTLETGTTNQPAIDVFLVE
jgi:geranylgeranyl pyrophosphate synthase